MIKTKDGKTTASGTEEELFADFAVTAESLLRRTTITAEELYAAVKIAEKAAELITAEELYAAVKIAEKAAELITAVGEFFGDSEEPEAEDEWVEAEKKATAKKGAVKETVLEADDLKGMMEWLKGELENLEDEQDD